MPRPSPRRQPSPQIYQPRRRAGVAVGGLLGIGAIVLVGCGPRNFENVNDDLRAERLRLQRQVEDLREQLENRTGELESLRQQRQQSQAAPMPGAEPPVLSRLTFGRYSGPVDTDDDQASDTLRIYLRPADQQGRLLPVAGQARVQAVAIPPQGEPVVVAERTYEPQQFDAAWRSGFTGEHYTLELDLPRPLPEAARQAGELTVKVTFTQAETGVTLSEQQAFSIEAPNPGTA